MGGEDLVGGLFAGGEEAVAGGGEVVFEAAAAAGGAFDQALGEEAAGQGAEGLLGLEGGGGEFPGRGAGAAADRPERVPLGEGGADGGQGGVEGAVLPVLDLLDGLAENVELGFMPASLPLTQLA